LRIAELKWTKSTEEEKLPKGTKIGRKFGREARIRKKDKEGKKMYENIFIGKFKEQEAWKKKRKHWGLACVAMFTMGVILGWLLKGI
jgi:hypothetical protein